ncbi:FAD-linked oxidase C-terminal domain-containing protein [Microbacterium sp. AZCO]|uniref:FAD-binding oxidoreductase n=1 Tax=Microbacterium sp. AZCO TaxID=3142976 RepID=UPI0031F3B0C5
MSADAMASALPSEAVRALREALPGRVDAGRDSRAAHSTDRSGTRGAGIAELVVHPRDTADVQEICRIASRFGIPLVPRGAGTGLAGGAVAGSGQIVVATDRMTSILEISVDNQLAVVQPGVLNGDLNAVLATHGLWWPPDPASKAISTVGGNIAMNAGGLLCAKYGVTRETVLALTVVLADGEAIQVGHRTVKGVSGLDLCGLFVGSEGTLGIITECTLKVRPMVNGVVPTIGAYFADASAAARASAAVTASGERPAIMELMDAALLEAVSDYTGEDLASAGSAYLLVQTDGPQAVAEAERIAAILRDAGARSLDVTDDPEAAASLVDVRRSGFLAVEARGTILVEDVAVPRDRIADMYDRIEEVAARYSVFIATPCHAGDGNLHPTFVLDHGLEEVPDDVWDAAGEIFAAALELGGTLSGEHGIGLLKRRWLGDELGPRQLDLQRRVKEVFDPDGIMNPGKVFPAAQPA